MGFKIVCNNCGNEKHVNDIFELYPNNVDDNIEIGTDIYENIVIYCEKCGNKAKGDY